MVDDRSRRRLVDSALGLGLALGLAACSDPPFDPAPHLPAAQAKSVGGAVIAHPAIVPIFFAGDDVMRAEIDAFHAALAAPGSSYWSAVTGEYGVGALTIRPTIVSTDAPPTTDDALQAWLAIMADGTHAGWPAADASTIYAVFLPDNATLTAPFGTSCEAFAGYHSETPGAATATAPVVYAVLPRCVPTSDGTPSVDEITSTATHEYVEAATDPHPFTDPAYQTVDPDHFIAGFRLGAELGDLCEVLDSARERLLDRFVVQRSWSNVAAAAGDDPCVPTAPGAVYVGAMPQALDDVAIDLGDNGGLIPTKGLAIPVGTQKNIPLGVFSSAPADITITVTSGACFPTTDPDELALRLDDHTGRNGDVLWVSIAHVLPGAIGGSEYCIHAHSGDSDSIWLGFVAN